MSISIFQAHEGQRAGVGDAAPLWTRQASGEEQDAAAWFARLRGPHAESISSEFEMWAARSEHHRRAYERIARLFDGRIEDIFMPDGP